MNALEAQIKGDTVVYACTTPDVYPDIIKLGAGKVDQSYLEKPAGCSAAEGLNLLTDIEQLNMSNEVFFVDHFMLKPIFKQINFLKQQLGVQDETIRHVKLVITEKIGIDERRIDFFRKIGLSNANDMLPHAIKLIRDVLPQSELRYVKRSLIKGCYLQDFNDTFAAFELVANNGGVPICISVVIGKALAHKTYYLKLLNTLGDEIELQSFPDAQAYFKPKSAEAFAFRMMIDDKTTLSPYGLLFANMASGQHDNGLASIDDVAQTLAIQDELANEKNFFSFAYSQGDAIERFDVPLSIKTRLISYL